MVLGKLTKVLFENCCTLFCRINCTNLLIFHKKYNSEINTPTPYNTARIETLENALVENNTTSGSCICCGVSITSDKEIIRSLTTVLDEILRLIKGKNRAKIEEPNKYSLLAV